MTIKRTVLVTLALGMLPTGLSAQTSVDIIQIWQNFVASRAAANDCNAIDQTTETHFLANLTDVSIRAAQALQERNPSIAPEQLAERIKADEESINGKVNAEIKLNGCQSPKISFLLKMYKLHSTMKF